jgi:hypothetical protein
MSAGGPEAVCSSSRRAWSWRSAWDVRVGLLCVCVCVCVVLFGAAAEAKGYKSYQDVLDSGDKADIEAMQAALEKAGYTEDKVALDGMPLVFVWFTAPTNLQNAPPRYLPYGPGTGDPLLGGGPIAVGYWPQGGTFSWSITIGGQEVWTASGTTFTVIVPGLGPPPSSYTADVTYTVAALGCCDAESGLIQTFAGDEDVEGIENGNPEDPEQEDAETCPGVLIGWQGARKAISLSAIPAGFFPEEEPWDLHFWSANITTSGYGGEVEFWTAPEGGEQVTYLSWYGHELGGPWSCNPIPEALWVQGTEIGDVDVTFTVGINDHYFGELHFSDTIKFAVREVGLKAVTFSAPQGGGFHDVCVDTTGAAYGTPHWEDNSDDPANLSHLDGDAEDWDANPADHQYPVCYESGKKMKVTVRFLADPREDFQGATIEGVTDNGNYFLSTEVEQFVEVDGKDYAEVEIESVDPLAANTVDWCHPLVINWTLRAGGRWLEGTSENEMFVTLGAPQCAKLYRTVAYLACGHPYAQNEAEALANTWAMFSQGTGDDEHPADVCAWNEDHRTYDRKLYYWKVANTPQSTTFRLLEDANGNCDAWVNLLQDALLANGVEVIPILVFSYEYPADTNFVVNKVGWDETNPDFPNEPIWKFSQQDIDQSEAGLPGQNMRTPAEKIFAYHHLRKRIIAGPSPDKTYYDPSYGITAKNRASYTARTIAGWGKRLGDGLVHYKKRGIGEVLRFRNPEGWEE